MLVPGHAHDLFLSYARVEAEWVEAFKKAFCHEFHVREGKAVSIWQDSENIRPGEKWTDELKRGVEQAAALLAIVSPSYQASRWCKEERDYLLRHHGGLEGLKVDHLYRLMKIFKAPTEYNLLGELQHVRFFQEATKETFAIDSAEFKVAVASAVTAIRELFRLMSNGQTSVYLGTGAMEIEGDRTQLENELTERSYKVRPGFPLDESYGPDALVKELEACSRAIFLLGGTYDKFVETQVRQAVELGKRCLFWIHPRLKQDEGFLKEVREGLALPAGSEVLGGKSIQSFRQYLEPKLKDEDATPVATEKGERPRVYLIFDATISGEAEAAAQVSGILSERKMRVSESRSFDQHRNLMETSDGALLLRTTRPETDDWWLNIVAPEVILSRQFTAKALVLADAKRLKVSAGDVPVVNYTNPLPERALDAFVERLQRARGAHAGS